MSDQDQEKAARAQAALDALLSTLEDVESVANNARVGISGDSGVGKTVLAMEIAQDLTPKGKDILFIDHHDGYIVFNNPRHAHLRARTRRMRFVDFDQLHVLVQAIGKPKVPAFLNVGCVVLDEVSSMVDRDLDAITVVEAVKDSRNPDVSTWPEYNIEKNRFTRLLDALCKMQIHVIFVTHIKKDKTPKGTTAITPSFQQAITQRYVRPLHVSALMRADLVRKDDTLEPTYSRTLQVHPTSDVWGFKTRVQDLPVSVSPEKLREALKEFMMGERSASKEFDEAIRETIPDSNSDMIEVSD